MLIDQSRVERLVVHRIGNPTRGEPLQLSERSAAVDDDVSTLILDGYLKGIVSDKKKHQLFHDSDLMLNEVYHHSRLLFRGEIDLVEASRRIARHLYARSQHPNISAGDLVVVLFSGLGDAEAPQRALGIFKAEIRDDFLTVVDEDQVLGLRHATGINPRLIDKGALVLESGPVVYAVDRLGQQTKFWLDDFLQAMRVPDSSTGSRMMASVVDRIAEQIEDPAQQAVFKDEFLALCEAEPAVSTASVGRVAERFVPGDEVNQLFDAAAQDYGFELEEPVPAKGVARRLAKTWSKVGVGHGMSLLLPSDLSLQNVHTENDGDELVLTLRLVRR